MRHRVYGRHLGRNKNERTALFRNLVRSLFISESIQTTEGKAKAIKGLVDQIITQAKNPNARRLVSQFMVDKQVAEKLVKDIAPRLSNRTSGYTSVVKVGRRVGDGSMIVRMSLLTEGSRIKKQESSDAQSTSANKTKVISTNKKETKTAEKKISRSVESKTSTKKGVKKA